jgi:hypothetical protein
MNLRNAARFIRELMRWSKVYPLEGSRTYNLEASAIYPRGRSLLPQIGQSVARKLETIKIGPSTPCISVGSCFAEEISGQMTSRGFNYINNEPNIWNFSADWGRVYTTANLRQMVDYSLDPDYPIHTQESDKGWFDPLRDVYPNTVSETETDLVDAIKLHRRISRQTIEQAEILFVTLGQNECFFDQLKNFYWGTFPPRSVFASVKDRIATIEMSLQDNVDNLTHSFERLKAANPRLQIVMNLSPVPAFATLCHRDVVETSLYYKCLLRVAAETVVRKFQGLVTYYPSFEIVLCRNPASLTADNRHVHRYVVEDIFDLMLDNGNRRGAPS